MMRAPSADWHVTRAGEGARGAPYAPGKELNSYNGTHSRGTKDRDCPELSRNLFN